MDLVKEYMEAHSIGFPTFEKLFNLKKEELLKVLRDICPKEDKYEEVLESNSHVYKTLQDDVPTKIKICSWSTIEISSTGIYYKPEHGATRDVVLFTEFFNLNL